MFDIEYFGKFMHRAVLLNVLDSNGSFFRQLEVAAKAAKNKSDFNSDYSYS